MTGRLALILGFAAATGCADNYMEIATDPNALNPRWEYVHDPAQIIAHYERAAEREGVSIYFVGDRNFALKNEIYLRASLESDIRRTSVTLAHEWIHIEQWRSIGSFGPQYLSDQLFRWAIETSAYRESVRLDVLTYHFVTGAVMESPVPRMIDSMRESVDVSQSDFDTARDILDEQYLWAVDVLSRSEG